jgi:hypothetical protein
MPRNLASGFIKCLLKAVHQGLKRNAQGFADGAKLNEVQPALSGFIFADERLVLMQKVGQLGLAETGLNPDLAKQNLKKLLA